MINAGFWNNKRVLVTGHSGFKGGWLSLWLQQMGAEVQGYALDVPTTPSFYQEASIADSVASYSGDVRNLDQLQRVVQSFKPDVVFHLAAQALVKPSYAHPVDTYSTNVMGTVNVLEAVRNTESVRSVVVVTSDKCYENREWHWGYRENEAMGGYDPYSNSKGCAELVTASYRSSFFNPDNYQNHGVAISSVRAGNVIGGGDWAAERLVPDMLKAFDAGVPAIIRSPSAIRPWQHVLEPLSGYLLVAQKMFEGQGLFSESWNFGPSDVDARPVEYIVNKLVSLWGEAAEWELDACLGEHEAHYLKLDCSKVSAQLGWQPVWGLDTTLGKIVDWYKAWKHGENMNEYSRSEIECFMKHKVSG